MNSLRKRAMELVPGMYMVLLDLQQFYDTHCIHENRQGTVGMEYPPRGVE